MADPIYLKNPDTGLVHLYTSQADADWAKQWLGWVPASASEITAYQSGKYISIPTGGTEPITRSQEYVAQFPYKAVTGTAITPESITIQKQAQALTQFVPTSQPSPSELQILSQYQTGPNQYDLVKMAKASVNDSAVKQVMYQSFDRGSIQYAEYAAKPPLDVEQWEKLSEEQRKAFRPVRDVTVDEYARMSDYERLGVRNIVQKKVSEKEYKMLGPRAKQYAYVKPGTFEKITGHKPTTLGILTFGAEFLIPGVYAGRHWKELSSIERGANIFLDCLIVGMLARPGLRLASNVSQEATKGLKVVYSSKTATAIRAEFTALDRAIVARSPSQVRTAGRAIEQTGLKLKAAGQEGATALIVRGRAIQRNAKVFATSPINAQPLTKAIRVIAKDERGEILARRERGFAASTPGLRGGAEPQRAFQAKTPRVKTATAEEAGLSPGEFSKFMRERVYNPDLSPEKWKAKELIRKLDWAKIQQQIEEAQRLKHPIAKKIEEQIRKQAQVWKQAEVDARTSKAVASEIVRRAAENEARINKMAQEALSRAAALKFGKATPDEVLTAAIARSPQRFLSDFQKLDSATQTKVLTRLDPALADALAAAAKTEGAAKTEALAKAQTLAKTETKTEAVAQAIAQAQTEAKTEVVAAPVPTTITDIVPDTTTPTDTTPDTPKPPDEGGGGDGGKPKKPRKGGGFDLEIKEVKGIPPNPGVISWDAGVVKVLVKPPYREGTEDIDYDRLKVARKGRDSQEATLKVTGGRAPQLIVLGRGFDRINVIKGKRMTHRRVRGPGIIDRQGRIHRQKRGSVI